MHNNEQSLSSDCEYLVGLFNVYRKQRESLFFVCLFVTIVVYWLVNTCEAYSSCERYLKTIRYWRIHGTQLTDFTNRNWYHIVVVVAAVVDARLDFSVRFNINLFPVLAVVFLLDLFLSRIFTIPTFQSWPEQRKKYSTEHNLRYDDDNVFIGNTVEIH